MSLLGIDVGTSGCKAAVFSETGRLLALAYEEYDILRAQPGWAELDVVQVWEQIQRTIRQARRSGSRRSGARPGGLVHGRGIGRR